jgi:uncharacterized protein YndB with AHSA1/START domain
VDPVTVETIIGRPRAEVFEYLADIANHAEFTDHFLVDWRLTREDTYGVGAGARYRIKAPRWVNRFPWADSTITEAQAPWRLVERGRMGKYNRIRTRGVYELDETSGGQTRVRFTFESEPKMLSDRIMEALGGTAMVRRKNGVALRRLRSILEEGRERGRRPTIAGGARKPASAYRFRPELNR